MRLPVHIGKKERCQYQKKLCGHGYGIGGGDGEFARFWKIDIFFGIVF